MRSNFSSSASFFLSAETSDSAAVPQQEAESLTEKLKSQLNNYRQLYRAIEVLKMMREQRAGSANYRNQRR